MMIGRVMRSAFAALLTAAVATAAAAPFDDVERFADKRLSEFSAVYIAPVAVDLPEPDIGQVTFARPVNRPVSGEDQARQAEALHEDLVGAFGRRFQLADEPAAGVLTVEATITRLASSRPTHADFERNPRIELSSVFAGGAEIEVRLSEEETALARLRETQFTSFNDGRPRLATWADANRVFQNLSRRFARFAAEDD